MNKRERIDEELNGKDLKHVRPHVRRRIGLWKAWVSFYLGVSTFFILGGIAGRITGRSSFLMMLGMFVVAVLVLALALVAIAGFLFEREKLRVIEDRLKQKT